MTEIMRMKPGVQVILSTKIRGGTEYTKETLEYPTRQIDGAMESEWITRKRIEDPDEWERASKTRDKARSLIGSVCAKTEGGLLCPLENKAELIERIDEAKQLVGAFNQTAVYSHVKLHVYPLEVRADDVEATRAIFSEIEEFMADMAEGMAELDTKKVRAICDKAVNLNRMLDGEASEKLELVVKVARAACTRIVKAGGEIGGEMERNTIRLIKSARTQFLDVESPSTTVARPVSTGAARALDLAI
jgi:hypothetical protein